MQSLSTPWSAYMLHFDQTQSGFVFVMTGLVVTIILFLVC